MGGGEARLFQTEVLPAKSEEHRRRDYVASRTFAVTGGAISGASNYKNRAALRWNISESKNKNVNMQGRKTSLAGVLKWIFTDQPSFLHLLI